MRNKYPLPWRTWLHLRLGNTWTFDRACAAPLVLWALNKSALAHRRQRLIPTWQETMQ